MGTLPMVSITIFSAGQRAIAFPFRSPLQRTRGTMMDRGAHEGKMGRREERKNRLPLFALNESGGGSRASTGRKLPQKRIYFAQTEGGRAEGGNVALRSFLAPSLSSSSPLPLPSPSLTVDSTRSKIDTVVQFKDTAQKSCSGSQPDLNRRAAEATAFIIMTFSPKPMD